MTQSVCKHCGDLDREFAHLKSANTGAWQYRNEHGHWVTCETQQRTSEPVAEQKPEIDICAELRKGLTAARPSGPSAPQVEPNILERVTKAFPEFAAPQTSAEPRKQCGCVHGDSDPYCPDPLCPNYIAAYHVKPPAPQPVSGDAPPQHPGPQPVPTTNAVEELAKAMHFWYGISDGSEESDLNWVWSNSDTIKAKWVPRAKAFIASVAAAKAEP